MRTTLNIEDEALAFAKERARASGKSLGAVVTEALLESHQPKERRILKSKAGLPYIPESGDGHKITSEMVADALAEEDIDAEDLEIISTGPPA
jgi:hypothetical protein